MVNMRETKQDTNFETSFFTVNSRINFPKFWSRLNVQANNPILLGKNFYSVQNIYKGPLLWHDLIISPPMYNNPSPLIPIPPKVLIT